MHPHQTYPHRAGGFTILEVMIATMVLAVGISAAIGTIVNNNNYRKSLDESSLADLVLRQMAARLKTTNIANLGHISITPATATPPNQAQGWTLHLRATASTAVPKAVSTAGALTASSIPPFRPLTQQDLVDASIIREQVGLSDMAMYVEYYNLNTETGLVNVGGMLVPAENGLIQRYNELQDASPTGSPRQAWHSLVGHAADGVSPTDVQADNLIMPATFSLADVDQPGTPNQVRGAFNHGLVIRILISWRPGEIMSPTSTIRQWRETLIVKRD